MIVALFLAQVVAGPAVTGVPVPVVPGTYLIPELKPAAVLQRYAKALIKLREPRVITFDYTLDQTGMRTLAQTHRVFRSGANERDETLTVDGKTLTPPKVRIFLGRRNRYTVGALAPRLADYEFSFIGPLKNAHHFDYVFRLAPKVARPFTVTQVTLDGVRFLPSSIVFETYPRAGSGSITFGSNAAWWVPYVAAARATLNETIATERLAFYTYRFPPTLPPSTFAQRRQPLPAPPKPGEIGPAVGGTAPPVMKQRR